MYVFLWLGILVAPLIGLMAGTWMTPEPDLRWQTNSTEDVLRVLGFVDQGSILLQIVAQRERTEPPTMQKMVVQGLDATTGARRLHLPVPEELRCSLTREAYPQLTDDGSAILFMVQPQTTPGDRRLVLYDWRKQTVLRRFRADQYHLIHRATYRNGTLVARATGLGDEPDKEYLLAWHGNAIEPAAMPHDAFQASISNDGTRVAVISTNDWHMQIIDVQRKVILQKFTGDFSGVRWLSGNQQFVAIVQDRPRTTAFAQRYSLQNDRYVPEKDQVTILRTPGDVKFSNRYLLARTHTNYEGWRKETKSYLGANLSSLLHTWWPEGSIRQLHDADTGELLHRVVLPQSYIRTGMTANPSSPTIAVYDEEQVTLWQYPTSGTYYPLIGIGLGLLISAIFFRYWQLHRRQALQNLPMVYLRREPAKPLEIV